MAKVESDITTPFIGRVGPVVGYMWKQTHCVRAYVEHIRYPNTESQQRERDWFLSMVRFAAEARPALKLGMQQKAREHGMTEGNCFVMMNKKHFSHAGGQVTVDYSRLSLSYGPAADVYFHEARFEEDETVVVDFEKNSLQLRASGEDSVYLYIYAPGLKQGMLSAPVARRNKTVRIRLPRWWSGEEVHLYGFVIDKEHRPSNTTYIGVGRVNHYEHRGRYIPLNKNWADFVDMANEVNAEHEGAPVEEKTVMMPERHPIDLFGDPPEVP